MICPGAGSFSGINNHIKTASAQDTAAGNKKETYESKDRHQETQCRLQNRPPQGQTLCDQQEEPKV
jgi:hypothetical protein